MGFTQLIGVPKNRIFDKGGRGVSQFQIFSDKGGRGGRPISDFWLTGGGRGVWTPPFLADIICEQPLIDNYNFWDTHTDRQTDMATL